MRRLFLVTTIITLLIQTLGLFHTAARRSTDFLFSPKKGPSLFISLIVIDDISLDEVGSWPWSSKVQAKLVEKIAAAHVKAIGYDVVLPPDEAAKEIVTSLRQKYPNLVFPGKTAQVFINTDKDGLVRNIPCPASLALAISRKLRPDVKCPEDSLRINYTLTPDNIETISASNVISGKTLPTHEIVLVGVTAASIEDLKQTPLSTNPLPGVLIHANAIESLVGDTLLSEMPKFATVILTLSILFIYFGLLRLLKFIKGLVLLLGFMAIYFLIVASAYHSQILLDFFYLPLGLLLTYVSQLAYGYLNEQRTKNFIRTAFGKYLSPDVVEELLKDPQKLHLGGERKVVTVLISDIRSFTSLAETTQPEELVNILNQFLSYTTEMVNETGGTLDKYVGDATVAFWNAPLDQDDHALRAALSALNMVTHVSEVTRLNIGIGLSTGEVFVGNVGSHERYDYTVIGDTVNIASRLEGLTKIFGVKIVASAAFKEAVTRIDLQGNFVFRRLDRVIVKGKAQELDVYELVGLRDMVDQPLFSLITNYEQALSLSETGHFTEALNLLRANLSYTADMPSQLLLKRCQKLRRQQQLLIKRTTIKAPSIDVGSVN